MTASRKSVLYLVYFAVDSKGGELARIGKRAKDNNNYIKGIGIRIDFVQFFVEERVSQMRSGKVEKFPTLVEIPAIFSCFLGSVIRQVLEQRILVLFLVASSKFLFMRTYSEPSSTFLSSHAFES